MAVAGCMELINDKHGTTAPLTMAGDALGDQTQVYIHDVVC